MRMHESLQKYAHEQATSDVVAAIPSPPSPNRDDGKLLRRKRVKIQLQLVTTHQNSVPIALRCLPNKKMIPEEKANGEFTASADADQAPPASTGVPVRPTNGQLPQLDMAPTHGRSYVAVSPPFLPTYPITMASISPFQQMQALSPRPKAKVSRTPCHHARYVLEEKPKRTPAANENMECSNCGTKNTSAWRRSADGKSECNACNLFFRKNGRKRPPSMRRDTIARRYRLSRCDLCEIETQKAPQDGTVQLQKSRQRRNGKKNDTHSAQSCSSSDSAVSTQQCFLSHPEFQQPLPNFLATSGGYVPQNPVMMNYNEGTMFNLMNGDGQNGQPSKRFRIGGDENPVLPLVGNTFGATQVLREQKETMMNGTGARRDSMCQIEPKDTMTFTKKELFDEHEIKDDLNKEPEHLIREDGHQLRNYKRRPSEGNKMISEMIKAKMTDRYGDSVKGDPLKCAKQDDSNKLIKKKTHEDGNDELTFQSL